MICQMITEGISESLWPDELETIVSLYHRLGRPRTPAENEYVVTESRILRNQIKGRILLTDLECVSLAQVAKRLGWQSAGRGSADRPSGKPSK